MRQNSSQRCATLMFMTQPHIKATAAIRHIILDTETTGISAKHGHRIIEIACLELVDFKPSGRTLHHYINPQRRCPPEATKIHGITDVFLQDKPSFAKVADDILTFLAGATLVAHNARFDLGFLNAELQRLNRPALQDHVTGVVDTLAMARKNFPKQRNSLDGLCERFGVDRSARHIHGALLDAQLLAKVYLRLHAHTIERKLEKLLTKPKAPNPINDFLGWQHYLTQLLPTDARVEVTLTMHYVSNPLKNARKPVPVRSSVRVRSLDIALSSMPATSCRLQFSDVYDVEPI